MKRRMLSICLALALCLSLLPGMALAAAPVYLALGDSITTGYAPGGATVDSPFAEQVAAGLGYDLVNEANDGETSTSLLERLDSLSSEIASADLITITIGGNDLMEALYGYLAANYTQDSISVDDVKDKLMGGDIAFLVFAAAEISGFAESNQATSALGTFTTNLASIIEAIKNVNSNAAILVATQYNPYEYLASNSGFPQAQEISDAFEAGVQALNTVISSGVFSGGYEVVDVYTAFHNAVASGTNPCNPSYTAPMSINLDFHPNQEGHNLIAETISETISDTTPDTPSGPAEEYDIWVGGTLVTSENAGDVLGNGTVAYDPDTNTLTLCGANITTPHEAGDYSYGIYAKGQLTIELEGQSTVGSNSIDFGVYMNGDLTITGTGSLNAVGNITGIYVLNGKMTVTGSTVTGTGAEDRGIVVWGELTVNGGKVTGTCNSASGAGIQVESSLTVNGGEVSGTGNIGIYTGGPLAVIKGTVTAKGTNDYGLRVNNGVIQTDEASTVTATSVAGRAIYNSSIWVNRVEYELAAGVTEFHVAGGVVVTDAVQVKVEALYVNNEDVLTANNNTVTCGGGTAVYDPDTNTLTLRDAVITGAYPESGDNYGIYAKGQLTIELVGQSTVGSNSIDYGVSMDGDLIITGTGSLTAAGSEKGIHVSDSLEVTGGIVAGEGRYGIDVSSLEVTGGTVAGTGENGAGVHVDGNLTVTGAGGKVDGTGGSKGDGIYVSGSLEVTGGTVTGTSTGGNGIRTEGYLTVMDSGTVTGTSTGGDGIRTEGYLAAYDSTVSGKGNNGIAAESDLHVTNSTVTAQGATGCGLRASEILIGYFEDTSNVTASSQVAGRAVESSSIQVNSKEYTMAEGATEFKVVNGAVVAGAESVLLEALYVNNVDVLTAPGYTVQCGSGTAVYEPDTNTLTLRNATITEGYEVLYWKAPYGIYAKGKLTICLEGASTVVGENASFYYGVSMDGDLTITGSGSLTAKGSYAGISAENLTVTGGTVDGIGEDDYGIYTDGLTVNGGTLNGRGGSHGIRIIGNLTVNSGTVDGAGDGGIWITDGNLTVNGGTFNGRGEGYGIWITDGSLIVNRGTVTGKGDIVAILGVKSGTGLAAGDIIVLPAGCLPAGYVLQAVEEGDDTYASFVPAGGQLDVNFEGTFSITGAAGEITLRVQQPSEPERPSGSGSSGGSSSTTTETQRNPDGSTTTTVTRPNGTTTETTRHPDGSSEVVETTKDGTVTTTTTDTEGNQTQVVENTDGSSRTTVDNQDGSGSVTTVDENGQVVSEATLSEAAVAAAHTAGEPVALPMPAVPVTTDRESAPTVTVNLPTSGSAKVEIPVKDGTPGTVAILIKADGTEEVLKASLPTENGVAVPLSDGDTVKLVDNSKKFADVPGSHWAADTIAFVTSRELFAGTTADTFAPDTAMSRAMIVTVLARLEGMDTATGDTWYEAGRQWAMASGVSDGTNMEQDLSREQLATMLWRYAQAKGYDVSIGEDTNILSYTDAFDVAEYAIPAMQWAVGAGIINGTGDGSTLTPQGPATRAQVATMLMRFCEEYMTW